MFTTTLTSQFTKTLKRTHFMEENAGLQGYELCCLIWLKTKIAGTLLNRLIEAVHTSIDSLC